MRQNFKSEIQKTRLDDFEFFVKRDDLLGEVCGGNKARKLEFFIKNARNLKAEFERNLPKNSVQNSPRKLKIISYGSSQSNAMAALSEFAKENDFEFIFICEKISNFLKQNPCGNYALALKNGAQIIENTDFQSRKEKALSLCEKGDIFVPEGIACKEAEMGFATLTHEISEQSRALGLEFNIFLPSGTGTSALYLAKHSANPVFTCPCVGDEFYLREQILELEPNFSVEILDFGDENLHPKAKNSPNLPQNLENSANFEPNLAKNSQKSAKIYILKPPRKFHFAKPYKELLEIYKRALKDCGIEFSLLYDSVGLLTMLAHKGIFTKPTLYIHQGGTHGNPSLLARYKFKDFA